MDLLAHGSFVTMKPMGMKTAQAEKAGKPQNTALMFIIQPAGFIPDWQELDEPLDPQQILAQQALFTNFREKPDQALFKLAFTDPKILLTPSCRYLAMLGRQFMMQLARNPACEFLREAIKLELDAERARELIDQAPFMIGLEHVNPEWLRSLRKRIEAAYTAEIKGYGGTVAEYLDSHHAAVHPAGRIFFHLVESKNADRPFAFLATYAAGIGENGQLRHAPLKNALIEYKGEQMKLLGLLSTVHRAAEASPLIRELVQSGEIFQPLGLTAKEAWVFLQEIPCYEEAGIVCRMPDWWKKRSSAVRMTVNIGARQPTRVGLDAIINVQINLALGDMQLSAEELRSLLAEAEGLRLIKGRWVEVDHARLKSILEACDQMHRKLAPGISLLEAVKLQMKSSQDPLTGRTDIGVDVQHGTWLKSFLEQMGHADRPDRGKAEIGETFRATLRGYQENGVAWLKQMKDMRLGACLADDMGLGKTVQIIALLNGARQAKRDKQKGETAETHQERSLLVLPASLIGNWKQEIERFAPQLQFAVLHPSGLRTADADAEAIISKNDLLITTYGMLDRYGWLRDRRWDTLILDEAQAIKNPAARQTQAAKAIAADWRVALTGTPVENRLSDLWSLMDFLNPGLLGSAREFSKTTQRLLDDPSGFGHLKTMLAPFILRRLKTDRRIIDDLPEKIEMKTFAVLGKKQAVLYRQLVDQLRNQLVTIGEGIERKGLVLASILKLKQICNHPDQYLGQAQFKEPESGKFACLREICVTIYEKRERVLVFTQFREMAEPLRRFLGEVFGHQGLVLHGGTPVNKRREIVSKFQGEEYVPFLVLSIKAGGVGLNLTAANHVIHFDRWWNPAVENQATDRAFRIGQQKNVIVHKFITEGTIEEKIDKMINDKVGLARDILPDRQEAWITEMNNEQLMDLFRLEAQAK
jgi:non-specific serine/threonine protein kinase